LMLAHSAFMGFGTVFFETAAAALFLGQFGASALPSVYLAAAALSGLTGYVYSRLQNRLSFSRLMTGTLISMLLIVSAIRGALFFSQAAGLFFFAMVFYRVLSILTDLEYWAVAGRLYDLRQAKRLFGFIGTGEVVARIIGSFSVPLLLRLEGVPTLLVLSAAALLTCVILLRRILPMIPADEGPKQTTAQRAARSSLGSLIQDPYLRFVLIVAFCGILGKYLVDFAFLQQVRSRFIDARDLASFFAIFSGISQCASLFTRVFLSGRVLSATAASLSFRART
jgi:ATP:ADP antiporter, AAA family